MGAAKFLRGLVRVIDPRDLTVIVNTGDDERFYGLHVSPDLDTVTYTLGNAVNRATGWGLAGESFKALDALGRFYDTPWFNLGDRDLATHLYRTERLSAGATLTGITANIADRFGVKSRILPMSDDRVHTHVKLRTAAQPLPFQEYFVRNRARGAVEEIQLRGIEQARPAPGVIDAVASADAVIVAPSNPFVSIDPIIRLAGVREALRTRRECVAAISPIVGGKTIKGPADKMMRGLGHEVTALGIAQLYADFVSCFVLDDQDRRQAAAITNLGMKAVTADTVMTTPAKAARLASVVLRSLGV